AVGGRFAAHEVLHRFLVVSVDAELGTRFRGAESGPVIAAIFLAPLCLLLLLLLALFALVIGLELPVRQLLHLFLQGIVLFLIVLLIGLLRLVVVLVLVARPVFFILIIGFAFALRTFLLVLLLLPLALLLHLLLQFVQAILDKIPVLLQFRIFIGALLRQLH